MREVAALDRVDPQPKPAAQPMLPHLIMPAHHDVRAERRQSCGACTATLAAAADRGPVDFADLLLMPGVGARTVQGAGAWWPRWCTARPAASPIPRAFRSPMAARTATPFRCR